MLQTPLAPMLPIAPPAPHLSPAPAPVRLKGSAVRLFSFETRRAGEARTCPPRTVGLTGLVTGRDAGHLESIGPQEAVAVSLLGPAEARPEEAAKGKMVFCNPQGDTLVYQTDRQERSAALCACGNATGAAAAMLAHCLKTERIRQDVRLPDGRVQMLAQVRRGTAADDGRPGWRVSQSWSGIRLTVRQSVLRGRRVAVCTGTLNDYLLVELRPGQDPAEFDLPEALAMWHEARRFGAFADPLRSRLAALAPHGDRPFASFFTCGRAHPGAPLTGLATLALAAPAVGWLGGLLQGQTLEHRRGIDPLPAVEADAGGCTVAFPAIEVVLAQV